MQDAGNQNAATFIPVEEDVLGMLMTAQAGTNVITDAASCRVVGKLLATNLKFVDVAGSLGFAPFTQRVIGDGQEVGFRAARKSKLGHG